MENCGNYLYTVKDSIGDVDEIWREDIITDEDDDKNIIQVWHPNSHEWIYVENMSRIKRKVNVLT